VNYGLLSARFPDKKPKNGHIIIFLASPLYGRFIVRPRGAPKAIRVAEILGHWDGLKTSLVKGVLTRRT